MGYSLAFQASSGNSRVFLLEGELMLYPAGISELPGEVQISVDAPRRSLPVRSFAHASMDGTGLQSLASDDLIADGARVALSAGDGALDLSNLVLISDGKHWTIHGGEGDLLGKPLFTAASDDTLRLLSNDQFQLHAELVLDPAFAQELGLAHASGAIAGALTLQGSSHPGNAVRAGAPQPSGPATSSLVPGPDIIVSTVGNTSGSSIQKYGTVGNTTGYAVTTVSCNIGTANAIWIDCTSGTSCNQHPVIGQNMYRLKTVAGSTRFEQIGMSWLKHGFCAADAYNGTTCPGTYVPNGSCDWLGFFATDTYGSGLNGSQPSLGPRSEINAWTGAFPYPYVLNWSLTGDAIYKRLQVPNADIDPSQNIGAQYWCEVQYVATDEPDGNKYINVSYRSVALGAQGDTPPGSNILFNGTTVQQLPAINAWAVADPGVTITPIDVPGDGRLYLGHKVTNLGGGQYHYEYALYNMNCDGSVQSVSVPVSNSVTLSNTGFRDVPYHSGEPYSGTDWSAVNASGAVTWSTQTFSANPNANALRGAQLTITDSTPMHLPCSAASR
jgi:hypothetical protein